ncbi:MAG: hypothetical protein RLZZ387_531 [Chloroflexota bacterium]
MRYEFATADRIVVGPGSSADLPALTAPLGGAALLVHGRGAVERGGATADLIRRLLGGGAVRASHAVGGEPDVAGAEAGAALARQHGCDLVIGVGGGSALDMAKAVAALAANEGGATRYLEVVGEGRPLERPALPVVAVPTTAGTGSEVTRNAVLVAPQHRVKASVRHVSMLPRLALVDAELTHEMPPALTASTGMDALTQLLEAYVSRRATPLMDGLCLEGLARARWALPRAYASGDNGEARAAMSEASLMSGLALANAGLGAVHGIAAPLGGGFPAPHGAACAALLPHVTAVNIRALRRSDTSSPALARYERVAEVMGAHGVDGLVELLHELARSMAIPGLGAYGVTHADVPTLALAASRASSTRGNPVDLELAELEEALARSLES